MISKAMSFLYSGLDFAYRSLAEGGEGDHHDGGDHAFGVHASFQDQYYAIIFLTAIYVAGFLSQKLLKMPSLVGEIFAGIILGPSLLNFVPNPPAFVLLGEIGLYLLVIEAGIDIDLTTLKLIGMRGITIAVIGSILPIAIAMGVAFALGYDTVTSVAAGAAFGPTSLGIAMNILRQGKMVNTPVGQLIVSAAVIDDMIALVILSLLEVFSGEFSLKGVLVPIFASIGYLVGGAFLAIKIIPFVINDYILIWFPEKHHPKMSLGIMIVLMIGFMAACEYSSASPLMGVFIAGLSFCRNHDVHHLFGTQFKRLLQWLMRIFFAAAIGFQVPIKTFGKGRVIAEGLLFTLALLGKVAVGLLVPNFYPIKKFTGNHMRDVLSTGFSMAAEGEFAFKIAVHSVSKSLISEDLYTSIVFAVLFSTIIPPFLLRFTINRYNKKAQTLLEETAKQEMGKKIDLESSRSITDSELKLGIIQESAIFVCIQIQCESKWGLLSKIMTKMKNMNIDVIDHRSWHPRGVDATVVNEVYAKYMVSPDEAELSEIQKPLFDLLDQPEAKVKVTRWYPGVVSEITEEIDAGGETAIKQKLSVSNEILKEAQNLLEKNQRMQLNATKERTVEEIIGAEITILNEDQNTQQSRPRPRPRRVRTLSTPVIGGDLFAGRTANSETIPLASSNNRVPDLPSIPSIPSFSDSRSVPAKITMNGETFQIQVAPSSIAKIRKGKEFTLHPKDLKARDRSGKVDMEFQLDGFVRKPFMSASLQTVDEGSDWKME